MSNEGVTGLSTAVIQTIREIVREEAKARTDERLRAFMRVDGADPANFTDAFRRMVIQESPALLVGWDGSCEYGRAVHSAVAKSVQGMFSIDGQGEAQEAAISHLTRHVEAIVERALQTRQDVREQATPQDEVREQPVDGSVRQGEPIRARLAPWSVPVGTTVHADTPPHQVSLVMRCTFRERYAPHSYDAVFSNTMDNAVNGGYTYLIGVTAVQDGPDSPGYNWRLTGVPQAWLVDLARDGSIVRDVPYGRRGDSDYGNYFIRFEARS